MRLFHALDILKSRIHCLHNLCHNLIYRGNRLCKLGRNKIALC